MSSTRPSLPIRSVAVAVVILQIRDGRGEVLLLRRARGFFKDLWCQVTGRIEAGESAWQAAVREVREETGLVPSSLYSADFCDSFYNPVENCIEMVPIFVALVDVGTTVAVNDENTDFQWQSIPDAIATVPFVGHRTVLQHVQHDFVDNAPADCHRITAYVPLTPL